ncbi:GGDEF domain-containing protein [Dokdonella immobilis]|uniref:diguanylate cyclase n=1 Tax=Dokdonella immobilis TaxID=578942 RepID=A0A1I4YVE7_9GAMM|nr:GGDEF domain-containing protein [Dokdonella immobilis]SFN41639.1 diguanylate cyclase (GGDEF) domain-containing protein [Dokdonella immobilis]
MGRLSLPAWNPYRAKMPIVVLPIDIPTLALSRGLVQMMLGGLLLYLGSRDETASAARLWALGFLLNGLSLFIFPLQIPPGWEQTRTILNHLTLGASSVFFLLGFWMFGDQPRRIWILVLMLAIPIGSLLAWEVLWPNARLRVLCTASGQALFLLALQHSLGSAPRSEIAQICRRLRYVVLAYLLVVIWSYASLADVLPTSAKLDTSYHRSFFSVASLLFMLSMAVGCLALQFALLAARNADLAMVDWQTGLLNRRGFFGAANRDVRLRPEREAPAGVIALDIDHFKRINDEYGHAAGDRVLEALGKSLRELSDPGSLVARMGGEEFCIVLPAASQHEARILAERIRAHCRQTPVATEDRRRIDFTVSAGVSETRPQQSLELAIARADEALYYAKRNGRDQVVLGTERIASD